MYLHTITFYEDNQELDWSSNKLWDMTRRKH
jgi:hypothetical protein